MSKTFCYICTVWMEWHHWLRQFGNEKSQYLKMNHHQNINKLSQYQFREQVLHDESIGVCVCVCVCVRLFMYGSILLGLFGLEPILSRLRPVTRDPRTHSGERSTQQLHPHCCSPWREGDKSTGKRKMIKNEREREGALGLLCLLLKFTSTVL